MQRCSEQLRLESSHCVTDLGPHVVLVAGRVHDGCPLAERLHDAVEVLGGLSVSRIVVDAGDSGGEAHGRAIADLGQIAPAGLDEGPERGPNGVT